jgi:hypothetical protein
MSRENLFLRVGGSVTSMSFSNMSSHLRLLRITNQIRATIAMRPKKPPSAPPIMAPVPPRVDLPPSSWVVPGVGLEGSEEEAEEEGVIDGETEGLSESDGLGEGLGTGFEGVGEGGGEFVGPGSGSGVCFVVHDVPNSVSTDVDVTGMVVMIGILVVLWVGSAVLVDSIVDVTKHVITVSLAMVELDTQVSEVMTVVAPGIVVTDSEKEVETESEVKT